MSSIPSPILIFGDSYLSKNNILVTKKKYPNYRWITKSATEDTLDSIREEAGISSWDDSDKILLIKDIPNKKQVREFLINLSSSCNIRTKIIIWDSEGKITIDPNTKSIDKTWEDFINDFRSISGSKIVNNGEELNEKGLSGVEYVIKCFNKYNKVIGDKEARFLLNIVGYDRGMLESEIKKMSITCSGRVTYEYILDNAFYTNKESMLYKVSKVLDSCKFDDCINLIDNFIQSGTNHNEVAAIIMKKARWQMVVAHLWVSGLDWSCIANRLMDMGKFPSTIWHDDQTDNNIKRKDAEGLQNIDSMVKYMSIRQGIPIRYFKDIDVDIKRGSAKGSMSRKNAEVIPMHFMAEQVVTFVRDRVVRNSRFDIKETRDRVLSRAISVYLKCHNKLVDIRMNVNADQDLNEMVRGIIDINLEKY